MKSPPTQAWTGAGAAGLSVLASPQVLRIHLLLFAALLGAPPLAAAPGEPVVLIVRGQRSEVLPIVKGSAELLPLDLVLSGFAVATRADPRAGTLTVSYERREVVLYARKSLAALGGDLRLLSSPVLLEDGRWLIPFDAVPRLLGPLLGVNAEWRSGPRVLVVGAFTAPRVSVSTAVSGERVRVVLEASEKVAFKVVQEESRVTVAMPRDLLDVAFQQERLTGGIVDLVQFVGGPDNVLAITLGRRFRQMKAFEQERPARLTLEFEAAPLPTRAGTPSAAPPDPAAGPTIVVIDPGHGGADNGAVGPGGTMEKDVALSVARKLRAILQSSFGYQVFLTRDRDQELGLDERTATANNYKADVFLSIHANSSRARAAAGNEVYFLSYQASDEESRRLAMLEGAAVPASTPGSGSDLALILWDMAQAEHLEESSVLATRLEEELAKASGSEARGVKQAPFRVLVGATMPAALVEMAFISNPEEEKQLASDAYQGRVAAALARGVTRFARDREQRAGALPRGAGR